MKSISFKNALTIKQEVFCHIFFWLLLAYFTLLDFNKNNPYYFSFLKPDIFWIFWTLVFVISFYFNYFIVIPSIFKDVNWRKVLLGLISFYLFFAGIRYFLEEMLMTYLFGVSNYSEDTNFIYYLYDNFYYSTYPLIPSSLLWLIIFLIRLLEFHAAVSEEKRNFEVKFLKSQLNPHFLFNTLNNIYSLVYLDSEKALPAIEKLSSIMRFTAYESQRDYVKLDDEIQYFKSYIELEQLRHQGGINIQMHLNVEKKDLKLPPLILSPLVENAIKHGFYDDQTPITIILESEKEKLFFEVKNKMGKQKKDKIGGIGLENLKKRLQIFYPGKHIFELQEVDNNFNAKLKIF